MTTPINGILFDLQQDPNELLNLIDNPEYTEIKNELKEQLQQLQIQYKDPIINNK